MTVLNRWLLLLAVLCTVPVSHAAAQPPSNTLERVKSEGMLRIGYGETPPFSFRDANGKISGYSIEICDRVVADLKQQLGLEKLDVLYVLRTDMNRVPLLNEGRYDLECEASTNSEERRRSVTFASPHFFTETRFTSPARLDMRTIDDLKGRSVGVVLGTVTISQIGRVDRERQLGLSLVRSNTIQQGFDLMVQGRVAAFAMDDILLRFLMEATGNAALYKISEESITPALPYGFMMRQGDKPFEDAVNAALARIYAAPDMAALYDRWFRGTVPGLGVHLDIPMSRELSEHFASFRHK